MDKMIERRKTKIIRIGPVGVGYNFPVSIQAMTKLKTEDINSVLEEINILEKNGAEIIRLAVKDKEDALSLKKIKETVKTPIVADIHFDYRLALIAINNGIDKIRINPGNIYRRDEIRQVILEAKKAGIPIRVGVNSGSIREKIKNQKLRIKDTSEGMVRSALEYVGFIEKLGFYDIVISLKASDVISTVEAYRRIANLCDYPLHLGITAAGASDEAKIKSAIGIGALLSEGIGDTIRVSLTGPSVNEVILAKQILKALNLRQFPGIELISCPTCGRCEVNLARIVKELENKVAMLTRPIKVAVMGCVVNGPGEAKEADLGLAFGQKSAILFKKGKIVNKVDDKDAVRVLIKEIRSLNHGRAKK